jgi:hypothetical protein
VWRRREGRLRVEISIAEPIDISASLARGGRAVHLNCG